MPTPAVTRFAGDLAQTSTGVTGSEVQVLGLTEWSIDRKVKTVDSYTTDDAGDETSLPSTRSWTAKAKYAYLDSDPTQAAQIFNGISSAQAAVQWNFFPTVATGRGAFSGKAFIDGYTLTAGAGKLVAVDISLKGTGPLAFGVQIAPVGGEAEN
jgi:hypothetical protein